MDWAGLGIRSTTDLFQGIATSVISADKKVNVSVNGTVVGCRALRDLTVAVGDIVLCGRLNNQVVVIGRLFQAAPGEAPPEEVTPPPKPQPDTVTGTTVFAPKETRSYRNTGYVGWRTDNDDVYQGEYGSNGRHIGCVFYNGAPRSLDGATVTSASIRARRGSGGDYAKRGTTLRMITNKTKPSGAPTFYTGTDAPGPNLAVNTTDSSISIPAAFAQALVDGTAGGLAIYESDGSPYVKLEGRADYSSSFTLSIKWKRET